MIVARREVGEQWALRVADGDRSRVQDLTKAEARVLDPGAGLSSATPIAYVSPQALRNREVISQIQASPWAFAIVDGSDPAASAEDLAPALRATPLKRIVILSSTPPAADAWTKSIGAGVTRWERLPFLSFTGDAPPPPSLRQELLTYRRDPDEIHLIERTEAVDEEYAFLPVVRRAGCRRPRRQVRLRFRHERFSFSIA